MKLSTMLKAMAGLLEPEYKEKFVGRAEVRLPLEFPGGTIAVKPVSDGKCRGMLRYGIKRRNNNLRR